MKILIVKTSSLGDIIHTLPVLSYLRKKFPTAQIDWAVERPSAELLASHPAVDNLFILERSQKKSLSHWIEFYRKLRKTKYDLVFDLQGNTKSGAILAGVRAKTKVGFAKKNISEWPNLLFTHVKIEVPLACNVREENLFLVQKYLKEPLQFQEEEVHLKITAQQEEFLKSFKEKDYILVCPGSFWPNKQISHDTLSAFLRKQEGFFLFAWGNESEKEFCEKVMKEFPKSQLLGKLPLPLLQNLMRKMSLVVAMDSLPLHLAATTGSPTFSFFGPTSALKYAPQGKQHAYIQGSCPYAVEFQRRCPLLRKCKTGACIKNITL